MQSSFSAENVKNTGPGIGMRNPNPGSGEKSEKRTESIMRYKTDARGDVHIYQRIPATELRVGDHILEHVAGHKPSVATPVLDVERKEDGVIVTIPDRHSDNRPVSEMYNHDTSVVISHTPHLETYDVMNNHDLPIQPVSPVLPVLPVLPPVILQREDKKMDTNAKDVKDVKDVKNVSTEKQQYPRMESHLKAESPGHEGAWYSAGLYVDKENQPRGIIVVDGAGKTEKHSVSFEDKMTTAGEKFLAAKAERENGKTLYVNIMSHEKGESRWLSAHYAERDPSLEAGKQLQVIEGKGGDLKPNAALLEKIGTDRTAKFVQDTFKVDAQKVHERSLEHKQGRDGKEGREGKEGKKQGIAR